MTELNLSQETVNKLLTLNVNDYTESKNGLTYLSWAYAISEILKSECDFDYDIPLFPQPNGGAQPYTFDENTGYMCFTSVTLNGVTRKMFLPVMDSNNRAMKSKPYTYTTKYGDKTVEAATMFDVNKTIMRCLTKNLAMFGLGLYIYAGEDLPLETGENFSKDKSTGKLPEYKETKAKKEVSKEDNKHLTKVTF